MDVDALRKVQGVGQVEPAWSADLLVKAGDTDAVVSRVHSVPGEQGINRLVLQDGRMPQSPGECVVEAGANATNPTWPIGTTIKATAREVYDVTGAGDTVISVLTLALAAKATLTEAAVLANFAAGIVVEKSGTATASREEIEGVLK